MAVNTCFRCGLHGPGVRVERCRRCGMLRAAACPGCVRDTGGMTWAWQVTAHEKRCHNLPRAQECES